MPSVTATAVGQHIDVTRQRVMQFVDEGVLIRNEDGSFDIDDCRVRYIRWLRDDGRRINKSASANRVHDARARDIELKIAERENRLVDIDDAIGAMDDVVGAVKAAMSGVPAQFTGDLSQRAKLETLLGQALNAAADMVTAQAADLRSGGGAPSIIAGDDA
ncbi:MAG: hypothetical protein Q8M31_21710 [Beijerinckiaceae bacterium]|nr:hypothetical protein [Beijerinckiaceae bacterium]